LVGKVGWPVVGLPESAFQIMEEFQLAILQGLEVQYSMFFLSMLFAPEDFLYFQRQIQAAISPFIAFPTFFLPP
jgi:hypothetical protein